MMRKLISSDQLPDGLLSGLSEREITLWLHRLPSDLDPTDIAKLVGLPWREVLLGESSPALLKTISHDVDLSLIRQRGYVELIENHPSSISLPPQSLPVYVLDAVNASESEFDRTLRRMAVMGGLRRSGVRHLLILSDDHAGLPAELDSLIDANFQPYISLASSTDEGMRQVSAWAEKRAAGPAPQLIRLSPSEFTRTIISRYAEIYPDKATIVRMRRGDASTRLIDLTDIDDFGRPLLNFYDIIQERDLALVAPEALSEEEFIAFFEGQQNSWRPFAAGVPWLRDDVSHAAFNRLMRRINSVGSAENKIAYLSSESGSGGTTLARMIAFEAARAGYPTLVARSVPFTPDPLPIVGYLTRAHQISRQEPDAQNEGTDDRHLYETPWVIVFDKEHFERREGDLCRFLAELTKSGRPAILLFVANPIKALEFYSELAEEIAVTTHIISPYDVERLGRHLNRFLSIYGKSIPPENWSNFYSQHSVQHVHGAAAFWIALSFWLRASRDLSGTFQEWIYDCFKEHGGSKAMKTALVEIAALSTERLSLNQGLLPRSDNEWPLSLRLEDQRQNLASLGLLQVRAGNEKYWGLAHDVLGRLLLNALFYDFPARVELGFEEAKDTEHMRFLALKQISNKAQMAELNYRPLAEQFATTIFKIDPDHGAKAFVGIWREVLTALDEMPKLLRDNNRIFRHHTAISRRRISALDNPIYDVTNSDRVVLLERAITDIQYALNSITRVPGDEPDVNLFNSLANAYLNLAEVIGERGDSEEKVTELRKLANEATRKAYAENPTNPWVIETHIRNLLAIAKSESGRAADVSLEALLAVYDALRGNDPNLRADKIGRLGEEALKVLFENAPPESSTAELRSPVDVLIATWRILVKTGVKGLDDRLAHMPPDICEEVLEMLSHSAGRGDTQIQRLRYGILSAARPHQFSNRLAIVENLQATDSRLSPQLQLEYALLLYQVGRAAEGDQKFRQLRRLWKNTEHFVNVPDLLNWLRDGESEKLLTVQARVGSEESSRPMARVSEFRNLLVPFRPEEFDVREMRPKTPFRAHVTFGHNGPFLRPVSAGPKRG
ncbi:hypothetical protein [Methylocapsa aurea]|uniref:hypothetical protein n=1 Tax=Methylocapsa aurea TaxID=663610 RepID=UPI003D18D648